MPDYLLNFELDKKHNEIFIHGDEKGLRFLIEALEKLISQTKQDHFNHEHLMTEEWAGDELSSKSRGGEVINHVKVYCWKGNTP